MGSSSNSTRSPTTASASASASATTATATSPRTRTAPPRRSSNSSVGSKSRKSKSSKKGSKSKKTKSNKQKAAVVPAEPGRVRFAPTRRVYTIPRHADPVPIWYTVTEYQSIFTRDSLILALHKGGRFQESADYTFRGLERHLAKKRIQNRRRAAVQAVLQAQKRSGTQDAIAEAYVESAAEALEIALLRGSKDAHVVNGGDGEVEDVTGYYLDVDDDVWETASANDSSLDEDGSVSSRTTDDGETYGVGTGRWSTLEVDSAAPRGRGTSATPAASAERKEDEGNASVDELLNLLQTTPLTSIKPTVSGTMISPMKTANNPSSHRRGTVADNLAPAPFDDDDDDDVDSYVANDDMCSYTSGNMSLGSIPEEGLFVEESMSDMESLQPSPRGGRIRPIPIQREITVTPRQGDTDDAATEPVSPVQPDVAAAAARKKIKKASSSKSLGSTKSKKKKKRTTEGSKESNSGSSSGKEKTSSSESKESKEERKKRKKKKREQQAAAAAAATEPQEFTVCAPDAAPVKKSKSSKKSSSSSKTKESSSLAPTRSKSSRKLRDDTDAATAPVSGAAAVEEEKIKRKTKKKSSSSSKSKNTSSNGKSKLTRSSSSPNVVQDRAAAAAEEKRRKKKLKQRLAEEQSGVEPKKKSKRNLLDPPSGDFLASDEATTPRSDVTDSTAGTDSDGTTNNNNNTATAPATPRANKPNKVGVFRSFMRQKSSVGDDDCPAPESRSLRSARSFRGVPIRQMSTGKLKVSKSFRVSRTTKKNKEDEEERAVPKRGLVKSKSISHRPKESAVEQEQPSTLKKSKFLFGKRFFSSSK